MCFSFSCPTRSTGCRGLLHLSSHAQDLRLDDQGSHSDQTKHWVRLGDELLLSSFPFLLFVIGLRFRFLIFQFLIPLIQIALFCLCIGRRSLDVVQHCSYVYLPLSGDPQYISMALYNSEAINGYPTGNLSLALLDKINPEQISFV